MKYKSFTCKKRRRIKNLKKTRKIKFKHPYRKSRKSIKGGRTRKKKGGGVFTNNGKKTSLVPKNSNIMSQEIENIRTNGYWEENGIQRACVSKCPKNTWFTPRCITGVDNPETEKCFY